MDGLTEIIVVALLGFIILGQAAIWKYMEKSRDRYMDKYLDGLNVLGEAWAQAWWWESWFRKQNPVLGCGCECDFVYPYGFVPEAGCPVHDIEEEE